MPTQARPRQQRAGEPVKRRTTPEFAGRAGKTRTKGVPRTQPAPRLAAASGRRIGDTPETPALLFQAAAPWAGPTGMPAPTPAPDSNEGAGTSWRAPAAPVPRTAQAFQVAAAARGLSTRGGRGGVRRASARCTSEPCEGRGPQRLEPHGRGTSRQRVSAGPRGSAGGRTCVRAGPRQPPQQQAPSGAAGPRSSEPAPARAHQARVSLLPRQRTRVAAPAADGGLRRRLERNSRATLTPGPTSSSSLRSQIRSPTPGPELRRRTGPARRRRGARRPRSVRGDARGAAKSARGPAPAAPPRGRGGPGGGRPGARRRGTRPRGRGQRTDSTGGVRRPPPGTQRGHGGAPPRDAARRAVHPETTGCDTMGPACAPRPHPEAEPPSDRLPAPSTERPATCPAGRPRTRIRFRTAAPRGLPTPAGAARGGTGAPGGLSGHARDLGSGASASTPAGPRTRREEPFPSPAAPPPASRASGPPGAGSPPRAPAPAGPLLRALRPPRAAAIFSPRRERSADSRGRRGSRPAGPPPRGRRPPPAPEGGPPAAAPSPARRPGRRHSPRVAGLWSPAAISSELRGVGGRAGSAPVTETRG
ncbi:basic proline-rich protein-like [Mustela erminea]|uniref:basic proline-rich protein-like n=1 Tax=Mustela erminea TaxID=36723 RepID=UPI0013872403|nr:basic proline-rich protein-like [Mustela erminea]